MKKKLLAIINKLGFGDKIEKKTMTDEDWGKVAAAFKEEYGVDFSKALEDSKKVNALEETQKEIAYALAGEQEETEEEEDTEKTVKKANSNEKKKETTATKTDVDVVAEIKNLKKLNQEQAKKIEILEAEPEEPKTETVKTEGLKVNFRGGKSTATHLFGIEDDFFARTKWFNDMAATRQLITSLDEEKVSELRVEYNKYGKSLSARYAHLKETNQLELTAPEKLAAGSIDYTDLESEFGSEYRVRRQDALIGYIRELPSVTLIFPLVSNVQDAEEVVNMFLDSFSQAYQSGEVFKGGYALVPEKYKVHDVMFKHKFSELKKLEKQYIGYLNREGSDPMKWTFIEYLIIETYKVLHNEQEERRVFGYRVDPETDVAGHYMFGSDGVIHKLIKYEENFQILPISGGSYTKSTILAYIENQVAEVNKVVPNLRGMKLYINEKHIPWYKAAFRETYGTDMDFKGPELKAIDYSLDNFVPVPNLPFNCYKMWITLPGNIELYEDKPGEMLKLYFEQRLEVLISASWWKEGCGAYRAGKKYDSLAELTASKRKYQFIFTNDASTLLAADAATADAENNFLFKTQDNTGATAFTNIENAIEGVVYKIECGGTANATTIAKSGNFSEISAAWTPTAVGDYIKVYYRASDGKFIEVDRKVTA